MHEQGVSHATLKERAWEELRQWLLLSAYLAAFFCAFTAYRDLTTDARGVGAFRFGYSLVEALVVAKFMLLGKALRVGERAPAGPLIVPVLYKSLAYGLVVLVLSVVEHVIEGAIRGERVVSTLAHLRGQGASELLARTLVMLVAFIPLFALTEMARVLGAGRLSEFFFQEKRPSEGPSSRGPTRRDGPRI